MKIGELAERAGVSVRALRYYEEKGALNPDRTQGGYRVFDDADVQTVGHVQTLLAAGLGLDLIGQILSCMTGETLLLDDCRERLEAERRRMTEGVDRIITARSILDDLLADTTPGIDVSR
ncbi:MAG: MerR family transcriptional regulator [Streptosporangiales bacterium]|nr:MerR family transcriptional regulator [Streptosporangiales bacterium]